MEYISENDSQWMSDNDERHDVPVYVTVIMMVVMMMLMRGTKVMHEYESLESVPSAMAVDVVAAVVDIEGPKKIHYRICVDVSNTRGVLLHCYCCCN